MNLGDELTHLIVELASEGKLSKSILLVDDGISEALRWEGGFQLLLRDFNVATVYRLEDWQAQMEDMVEMQSTGRMNRFLSEIFDPFDVYGEHVLPVNVVIFTSEPVGVLEESMNWFLKMGWRYMKGVCVCTSLSEKAHLKCYESVGFREMEDRWNGVVEEVKRKEEQVPVQFGGRRRLSSIHAESSEGNTGSCLERVSSLSMEDWGWEEESGGDFEPNVQEPKMEQILNSPRSGGEMNCEMFCEIRHVPLHYCAIVNNKNNGPVPTFALTNKDCADVFPLMRTHLKDPNAFESVKDVLPEHIPKKFRKSFRLLAHVLADIMMTWRLQVKQHIYAMGSTASKLGHTLQQILDDIQDDMTTQHVHDQFQNASIVLVDRTLDLTACTSHDNTLMDRVIAELGKRKNGLSTQSNSNLTEIHPTNDMTLLNADNVHWNVGAVLAHSKEPISEALVHSMICKPPKLALRHLDKELREIVTKLVRDNGCIKPKRNSNDRGRDVVLRWMQTIADFDINECMKHYELFQVGLAMLETLERTTVNRENAITALEACEKLIAQHKAAGMFDQVLMDVVNLVTENKDIHFTIRQVLQLSIHAISSAGVHPFDECTTVGIFRDEITNFLLSQSFNELALMHLLSEDLKTRIESNDSDPPRIIPAGNDESWDWIDEGDAAFTESLNVSLNEENFSPMWATLKETGNVLNEIKHLNKAFASEPIPSSLMVKVASRLLDKNKHKVEDLQHIVDASEQLTRAGIDFFKHGMSRFGFGSSHFESDAGGESQPADNSVIVLFVIGGITFQEIQQISELVHSNPKITLLVGTTAIVNADTIYDQLFNCVNAE